MSDTYHFQVNLGGMLDVLSNHLYKSPDVFLRELLQNGVDAVTLRQKSQPDWNRGKLHHHRGAGPPPDLPGQRRGAQRGGHPPLSWR